MSKQPFEVNVSRHFVGWLRDSRLSLAFTTYQTNRLFLIGAKPNGRLSVFERLFDRPMGLWADPSGLVMTTRWQIWELPNALAEGETYEGFDRLYIPRRAHTTGALDAHDVAIDADGRIVFVNTMYSCLATTSEKFSFKPLWQPSFISRLAPEDRCHLNGLAMEDGRPAYVTAVSRSDVLSGWRDRREAGGSVIDVATSEMVTENLSMPHSPRINNGDLWVLNSGTGDLGRVERDTGAFEPVCFCPGFLRGLDFHGHLAVVGLSKPRRERTFSGLELDDRLRDKDGEARCGLYVIDTKSGNVAHWLEFEGLIEELYDVVVLPGVKLPTALGFKTEDIQTLVTIDTGEKPVLHAQPAEAADPLQIPTGPPPPGRTEQRRKGRTPEARALFKSADTLVREGNLEDAVTQYVAGLRLEPDDVEALIAIASVQEQLGRRPAAIDCLTRAVRADPWSVKCRTMLAYTLVTAGDLGGAITHLQAALASRPDDVGIAQQLGQALFHEGRFDEAKAIFEHAVRTKPGRADAYNGLAAIASFQENFDEALRLYEKAASLAPGFAEAHQNIGRVQEQQGNTTEAKESYKRAHRINGDPVLYLHTELLCPHIFGSTEELDAYRDHASEILDVHEGRDLEISFDQVQSSRAEAPFDWAYQGRDNLDFKKRYAALFVKNFDQPAAGHEPPRDGRWRIGFVVTPQHEGIFGRCMSGIVNRMDRKKFRVEVYASRTGGEFLKQVIRAPMQDLPWRFDHAVMRLREAKLDAIYHWEVGTDATNYFLPFLRLAPVQCTGWGWPDTSGAPELDYHITTAALTTPNLEQRFTEELVVLPELSGWFPRTPIPREPRPLSEFGIDGQPTVYLCHQTLRKVHPDFDQLIGGILAGDENGAVVFVADKHVTPGELLRQRWKERLPDVADRILMLPRLTPADYVHVVAGADVSLDTLYFGGTITTYDSLAAGKPVVTCPTDFPRGRNAAALCAKVGIESECVAADPGDYVDKALALGKDRGLRVELADRIRAAHGEIFERADAVTQLEDFFEKALNRV